ncbi:hypothetical protein IKE67_01555 [bacterium]|nr:hypothetical protein [bacterium]
MQEELQIQLDSNEEILAEGEKNQVMYIGNTLLLIIVALFFLYYSVTANNFFESFYFAFLSIIFFITIIYTLKSYKYNQIYLTDKKIVITKKDSIDVIQYDEIKYIMFNIVYLKSKRMFFFAYTNLDDLTAQFKEVCPHFG